MNARRFGVSTIWAMFSRVTSKTSGSSLLVEELLDLGERRPLLGGEVEVHVPPSGVCQPSSGPKRPTNDTISPG